MTLSFFPNPWVVVGSGSSSEFKLAVGWLMVFEGMEDA